MIINPYSSEIENISFSIQSHSERCIAFTSATPKEGVSTVIHSVTQRLLLAGYSVLLVDLNSSAPALEKILSNTGSNMSDAALDSPQLMAPIGEQSVFTGVTIAGNKSNIAQLRKPQVLRDKVIEWKTQFDYVLIDCPPVLNPVQSGIPAEQVVQACDAAILITLSQKTTEESLVQAMRKLDQNDITLLGVVLNDQRNPGLKEEFNRQIKKISNFLPKSFRPYLKRIGTVVDHSPFFSIDT